MINANFFKNRNKEFGLTKEVKNPIKIILTEKNSFSKVKSSMNKSILNWISFNSFFPSIGSVLCVPDKNFKIKNIYAGIGKKFSLWDISRIIKKLPFGNFVIEGNENNIKKYAIAWSLESYEFNYFSNKKVNKSKKNLILTNKVLNATTPILDGCYLARDLINLPPNILNPNTLEEIIVSLAKEHNAKLSIIKSKNLIKQYPLVHFVGRSSENEPRVLDLKWGDSDKLPLITLIGKGVTFDSGGLDLKSPQGMELMKKDMGGAAVAIGLGHAIMSSNFNINLRIILPIVENAVSDKSMRPSDIIKSASGINVEIGNTDAEGRLILADSLYHATNSKKSNLIIDFATLTGAARIALGTELPAIFSNNKSISKKIIEIGKNEEDPLWELPLYEQYDSYLDLENGQLSNIGSSSYGGAITAALFLSRFVQNKNNWVHIDLMGWNLISKPGRPKGGEAMTLRSIYEFILKEYS